MKKRVTHSRRIKYFISPLLLLLNFFCLNLISLQKAHAQDSYEVFQQGNAAYEKGDFDQAITNYQTIYENGEISPELFHNLGNAYFQEKDYVNAILYYEKGLKLDPNQTSILTNLEVANDQINSDIVAVPPFILIQWWRSFSNIFSVSIWAVIQILFLIAITVSIVLIFIKPEKAVRKKSIYSLFLLIPLFVLTTLAMLSKGKEIADSSDAIIKENTILNMGPDIRSDTLTNLTAGDKLQLDDEIGEWFKVRLSNQMIGWIEKSKIERI